MDDYFRNRLGSSETGDRIIIAQISGGVTKALLWEGSPRAFKNEFGSGKAFRTFLWNKSDRFGSRVHGGLADSLDYLLACPGVMEKKTKTAILAFTDMEDNDAKGDEEKARLLKLFAEYSKVRGCCGMYWVDTRFVAEWEKNLRDSGMKHYAVYSEIVADPPLPSWSD